MKEIVVSFVVIDINTEDFVAVAEDSDEDESGIAPPLPDNVMVKLLANVMPLTGRYDPNGRYGRESERLFC